LAWTTARFFELGGHLQSIEGVAPHFLEQSGNGAERFGAGSIEAVLLLHASSDEPGFGERSKLERDGAKRDIGEGSMNLSGRQLAIPDQAEDFAPAW
jgi:hypothetical protein